ncbi:MarR family transcriptional regulator [Novosphingobium sp. TCA1]|uniref:MarR family transcriptional regulator n=1 Tax=Novosphingobium pentaromativorans TaxID=205844 RepID=A0A2W5NW32_9SPHN|nr:MarR family transcriptional regulator [Novosphingobium sp. TCA1]PZQ57154.1 MAG: MarR family transcriptional regulator [Novosphingobium pentaromativorans]GFE74167.1 hypothetical protein NTCA1_18160 [Novosphingobium sp. TCA1]
MQGSESADFSYGVSPEASGGTGVSLSIFADRPHLRATMREDAAAAGLHVSLSAPLGELLDNDGRALADVVLLDCPLLDAATMAALARLDLRAAKGGTRLIVSTSVDALDDVFACMDMSSPLLLVDPNRAERVMALGEVLAGFPAARLRELSEDDRLMLLRLSEQVGQIAGQMDRMAPREAPVAAATRGPAEKRAVPLHGYSGSPGTSALPESGLIRRIIRQRQLRARFIDGDLFADPAWDMLLDLAAARVEGKQVSVTSLCIASGVPPTTALRWIGALVQADLFQRVCDENDRRRAFIELTEQAVDRLGRYFDEISSMEALPV